LGDAIITQVTPTPLPADRPYRARRRLIILGVGLGFFLLFNLLALAPGATEVLYATSVGPLIARVLSHVTGVFPFSVAELLYVAYPIWLIVLGVVAIRTVRSGQRRLKNALVGGSLRLARDAGILLTLFYVLWGFNYARDPLDARLGWEPLENVDVEELIRLTTEAVEASNAAYLELHETEDAGSPTAEPEDGAALEAALEEGWRRAAQVLNLPGSMTSSRGRVKRMLLSPVFARLGVTGFYFPFTAEAHVRRGLPAVTLPNSMAHEKAHQRGTGPESEANFLGYVVGTLSDHPHARYAAVMFAQRQLASALFAASPSDWQELAKQRLPGVRRDLEDMYEYFQQFQGVGTEVGRVVNDQYLKANRVRSGVLSYQGSIGLLIAYSRENAGNVVPAASPSTVETGGPF
jgi:hypothetical protein